MTDMDHQITASDREVRNFPTPAGDGHTVLLRRTYDAPIEDVWSACTEAERLARWFVPVTGNLRLGGSYQLEGNAGGEILVCEPPRRLVVSWIYGEVTGDDELSQVEVRLSPSADGGTLLEVEHRAVDKPERWAEFGPGATGVGWDLTLLGLGSYLQGTIVEDKAGFLLTPEARDFMRRSSSLWRVAHEASGASAAAAAAAAGNTAAAYAPEPAPPPTT